ncbi:MAG: hypothetical protein FWD45_00205 [Coriobacteriia bacterium]|nr:hypothetical protein [Coriobacteriia bacterium]
MPNEDNLRPQNTRTKSEQRAVAVQGGKASGAARRQKKLIRDNLQMLMEMQVKPGKAAESLRKLGIPEDEMTNQMAMAVAAWQEALKGNVRAQEYVRDTIGQRPADKLIVAEVDTDWFIEDGQEA